MTDEALPNSPVKVAQEAASFQWGESKEAQAGIGIALSGGGFRAMLFHAGALARMNELGLLSKAKRIAGATADQDRVRLSKRLISVPWKLASGSERTELSVATWRARSADRRERGGEDDDREAAHSAL